ncbi:Alpha/Beta hydrolase protein [Truncatella angustata]|uniref:Alpha/Beta hydrolase protein n=1 Tax=Truncatella angustata TaxID=152316 RepID=A0A9P8ULC5_9PEZI|nr:Alpha/Beta hydrolase protein [Truncatella angustata]KAH6654298.1 Alpha/Beta hydrolase protein [Truncatella angustata]
MKCSLSICLAFLAASAVAAPWDLPRSQTERLEVRDDTPVVDLGYEQHSSSINSTGNYYLFSNIPYAQQPIGDLRFREPILPAGTNSTVNSGSTSNIECMQAYPEWIIELQAAANGVDVATMAYLLYNSGAQTESCLVLDIYVPTDIYNAGLVAAAPVLVWIHGGGFAYGSKTGSGQVAGLLARSNNTAIIVSINYRLGMFGWLDGSDVTPNLGLYDQRLAFEWIEKYISKFGGSPKRVTALGESAGASSLMHHITAYGGGEAAPFDQAVIMSPAYQFNLNGSYGYDLTMEVATNYTGENIDTTDELRALSSAQLKYINQGVVYTALVGLFNYGPVVDGTYVPNHPQVLLLEGKFDHSVKLMISHTSNESVPFTSTNVTTSAQLREYVIGQFPGLDNETYNYMLDVVWPDVLDGTYPWTTEFARAVRIGTEIQFACSARYLSAAFKNATYDYIFAYPPGYHAQDVPFVFFNGDTTTLNNGLPVDPTIAHAIQDHIVTFTLTGDPNYIGQAVTWPQYGSAAQTLEYTYTGQVIVTDDLKNNRCAWIQGAMANGTM